MVIFNCNYLFHSLDYRGVHSMTIVIKRGFDKENGFVVLVNYNFLQRALHQAYARGKDNLNEEEFNDWVKEQTK